MLLDSKPGKSRGNKTNIRIPKQVLLIGAGVLALCLLVVGVVALVSGLSSNIESAFQRTIEDFSGAEEQKTQFQQFLDQSEEKLKDGKYSMYMAFSGGQFGMELQADYDRARKLVRGDVDIAGYELEYSVKKKIIQIRFPGEYEVYGFNTDDLKKLADKIGGFLDMPFLSEVIPADGLALLDLDIFGKTDAQELIDTIAGEQYDAFKKSVEIERWNDETVTVGGKPMECKVYKISWKSEAANNLLGALGSGGMLPNVGELINSFLPEMDPYIYCYINDEGYMTGARFTVAGSKCFLLLQGEENLWDDFTLTAENMAGEVQTFQGYTVRNGASMDMYLTDGTTRLFSLIYDDETGDFRIGTVNAPELLYGQVQADSKEVSIRLYWTIPDVGDQELVWRIGELERKPEQLGERYTDLMGLGWAAIENLFNDLLTNLIKAQ